MPASLSQEFTVRQAVLADLDLLAPLFDQYRRFYGRSGDLAAARAFLGARFEHGQSVVFIAHEVGVGLGFTQLYPTFSSLSLSRKLVLNDLFVIQAARRRGVGQALLGAAAEYGRSVGASGLELCTAHTNLAAQALYRRAGWVLDEEFLHYGLGLRAG